MKDKEHDQTKKDSESQLLVEKERFESFLEHVGGGLGLLGPDCRIIWTNKATENNYGLTGPVAGKYCRDVMLPSPEQCQQCPIPKAFKSGQTETTVMETSILPGDSRYYQFTATPIINPDGTISQVMLLAQHVTDQVHNEQEIQTRNEMLEVQNRKILDVNRQKNQFFANISHELRTPLTSIIGFTEILLEDGDDPVSDNQRDMLRKVSQNAERLLTMINDLLDLSKMEEGRMTVTINRVSLAMLITQVVDTMLPLVKDKALTLKAETPFDLPIMRTDEQKLSQILVNLISNAIKFTPSGNVTVKARLSGRKIEIEVSDTGIGIKKGDFKRIFEEFRQIDGPATRNTGTGLGLAITRKLAYLLGGDIKVSSTLGTGSTFIVTLPVILNQSLITRRTRTTLEN